MKGRELEKCDGYGKLVHLVFLAGIRKFSLADLEIEELGSEVMPVVSCENIQKFENILNILPVNDRTAIERLFGLKNGFPVDLINVADSFGSIDYTADFILRAIKRLARQYGDEFRKIATYC